MKTRLITTYEEAKALKAAQYPQGPRHQYADLYYVPAFDDGTPGEDICTHADSHECAARVRMARLDELLAFLWEQGYDTLLERWNNENDQDMVSLRACKCGRPSGWKIDAALEHDFVYESPIGGDIDELTAVVQAVLYVLTEGKSAPPSDTASPK